MSRQDILERIKKTDDWITFPSCIKNSAGDPEFEMLLARKELRDPGSGSILFRETRTGGFEYASRAFIHAHLQPGDSFIDIGAHFGLYTLTAARKFPEQVRVLAVEPHPANVNRLKLWLQFNECSQAVTIVECAASDYSGYSQLNLNSSMGHSLQKYGLPDSGREPLNVRVETVDRLAAKAGFTDSNNRIFLKIDTEGHEYSVLKGTLELLKSGRVKAVIWEKGLYQGTRSGSKEFGDTLALLRDLGYESYRFPHEDMGGPLVPYVPSHEQCNIISIERSFERLPVYSQPWKAHTVLSASMRPKVSADFMAGYTSLLMERRSTDCGRWSRWNSLSGGTDLRAGLAGQLVPENSSVLDVGAGLMLLRDYIPASCTYTPLDIVARNRDCIVADLNQQQYPDQKFDVVCALNIFEFIHDVESFVSWARKHSEKLIFTYYPIHSDKDHLRRRAAGFFNDFTHKDIEKIITSTGWQIVSRTDTGYGEVCFECT